MYRPQEPAELEDDKRPYQDGPVALSRRTRTCSRPPRRFMIVSHTHEAHAKVSLTWGLSTRSKSVPSRAEGVDGSGPE